jgi:uncharacterized membrane protein YqhA
MLQFALLLRFVTLVASVGAGLGAVLMFWVGGAKLAGAMRFVILPEESWEKSVIAAVLEATDAFLFGIVLIVFAYGITFGFAIVLPRAVRLKLPPWMRIEGISEIKNTLIQIILVYLIVDFATDITEVEQHVSWDMLLKPVAILLLAGALRLLGTIRFQHDAHAEAGLGMSPSANQQ